MADKNTARDMTCIILAGGRGSRMASADRHKVCFPVAGRPAIVRAIDTYKAAGIRHFLVVVGQLAEQVISTVAAEHPDVAFVYQPNPRGTGHAARIATDYLDSAGYDGDVMIVMGDKLTTPDVVKRLLGSYSSKKCDLLLATLPVGAQESLGRVVTSSKGALLGIVERADLDNAVRTRRKIMVGSKSMSAAQIQKNCRQTNGSMYCVKFNMLTRALAGLEEANAQGELYLTDTVAHIAAAGKAHVEFIEEPSDLMAFNTPAELLDVERVIESRRKPSRVSTSAPKRRPGPDKLKTAGTWLELLNGKSPELGKALKKVYGDDPALISERRKALVALVRQFIRRHGADREMILCRAPGRLNLMGRHVDHRGGFVNVMAISREVILAASLRDDDMVCLSNMDSENFPDREFRLFDLLHTASWSDWIDFVNSRAVKNFLSSALGDWSHYARAPLLRLQHECRDARLSGMDCVVGGNIPPGAGLSSSSAVVVAFAEAALAMNRLDVKINDFIDICGEGEWFVGTRGGSADHAAIRTSKIGEISRIGFFPFHLAGSEKFPSDLSVVVAYSGSKAAKSAGARDVFNQRILAYELAGLFLRRYWPAAADMRHLRDLSPTALGVDVSQLYNALCLLPERPTMKEFAELIPRRDEPLLAKIIETHGDKGRFDLRGVALFGLSEMARSERFASVIGSGDLAAAGRMMAVSHDGDRCFASVAGKKSLRKFRVRTDNATLMKLAESGADLADQPGRYACSTQDIDFLVDTAMSCDGVVGAQLAGAGLGGCMMILVKRDKRDALIKRLNTDFYKPRKLPLTAWAASPVAGAGLLSVR